MTVGKIVGRLESLGIPIAYLLFKESKKNPTPPPPFAVWFKRERERGADKANNLRDVDMCIELYTDAPDAALETKMERLVLQDMEHEKDQAWIDTEAMTQTAYSFTFVEKRRK